MAFALVAAFIAFAIVAVGVVILDSRDAARRDRIARIRPRPEIGTPYSGPLYNRHGREIGESN